MYKKIIYSIVQYITKTFRSTRIPKKLHFIWLGSNDRPRAFEVFLTKWRQLYPDYEIIIWDDEKVDKSDVIPKEIKPLYEKYSKYPVYRSDLLRYCILYKLGGLYFDVDFEPLRRIQDSFLDFEFLGGIQNNNQVAIGFLGSQPGSELLKDILSNIAIDNYKFTDKHTENIALSLYLYALAGPEYFDKYCDKYRSNSNYFFFTKEYLYPYWFEEKEQKQYQNFKLTSPLSYGVHHWAASWKEDSYKDEINKEIDIKSIEIPRFDE